MRLFYMSFADEERGFLGACLVEVDEEEIEEAKEFVAQKYPNALPGADLAQAAMRKAHLMACNPGGQVLTSDVTDVAEKLEQWPRYCLLSKSDLEQLLS